jgi:hypothetical protein
MTCPNAQEWLLVINCRVYDRWLLMASGRISVAPGIVKCEFLPAFGIGSGGGQSCTEIGRSQSFGRASRFS